MTIEPKSGTSEIDAQSNRAGTDPLEAAAVHSGWTLLDAYERLGADEAQRIFAPELQAWHNYARSTVLDLVTWPKVRYALRIYESESNRLRFRRMLDFVVPGDNVFDIGLGRGYQCGLLLRDGNLASYRGIDIEKRHVVATAQMLEVNQLAQVPVDLAVGDLYDLSAEQVAGADLIICCEVLEHLPEPERALKVLAEVLPEGSDLLISVPLLGRLDDVWGHCTVFDGRRVREMVAASGLWVHHVEPLANKWTMAVLSRDPKPSERVMAAARRRPSFPALPLAPHRDFIRIDLSEVAASANGTAGISGELEHTEAGLTCRVPSAGRRFLPRQLDLGGFSFPVEDLRGLRLEFGIADFRHVDEVNVDAYAGERRVARWTWSCAKRPIQTDKKTFVLRPGISGRCFKALQADDVVEADRVEVWVKVTPGESGAFTLKRAACLR